jgi:PiT family inorganic phosphate transporter
MISASLLVVVAALALAFANGANDNAKGVATLIGAGRLDRRRAVRFATIATLLGSVAALVAAKGLLARFSGKGLVAPELIDTPAFSLAIASGAATTVLVATRLGLPVSTTHALVGGLAGVGLASERCAAALSPPRFSDRCWSLRCSPSARPSRPIRPCAGCVSPSG